MFLYDWYVIEDFYSKEECDDILLICQKNQNSLLKDRPAEGKKVVTSVTELEYFGTKLDKMFRMVTEVNHNYYGFDLFQERPLGMNFNTYSEDKNEYPYHRDCNSPGTSCDSKLTVILNISKDSYEGGDFSLFFGYDKLIPELHKQGTLFIFPSYFYHKVSPVTAGTRTTISTWIQGPNFR